MGFDDAEVVISGGVSTCASHVVGGGHTQKRHRRLNIAPCAHNYYEGA